MVIGPVSNSESSVAELRSSPGWSGSMAARATLTAAMMSALFACGGGGDGTGPREQGSIQILVQPQGVVAAGERLDPAPMVRLIRADGTPLRGAADALVWVDVLQVAGGDTVVVRQLLAQLDDEGVAVFDGVDVGGQLGSRVLKFWFAEGGGTAYRPEFSRQITVIAGAPQHLVVLSVNDVLATVGEPVLPAPSVAVLDDYGNPVEGVVVQFTPSNSASTVSGGSQISDAEGVATVGEWTLGTQPGLYQLDVTLPSHPYISAGFRAQATGTVRSNFTIELVYLTSVTAAQAAAFDAAKARWEQMIIGDIEDVTIPVSYSTLDCGAGTAQTVSGTVDDVRIYVELRPIDGANGTLGSAGPCDIRRTGSRLPHIGLMYFDTADLFQVEAAGELNDLILHEMGHVLGFGTLWEAIPGWWTLDWLSGACPGPDPVFTGPAGVQAYQTTNGGGGASGIPVENVGACDDGTRDSHWRESIFRSEVMTGYLSGSYRPFSAASIGSMQDLGYRVDLTKAEPFNIATQPTVVRPGSEGRRLVNDVLRLPRWTLTPTGERRSQYSKP